MKNLLLLGNIIFSFSYSQANPINASLPVSGNWSISSTWLLNRVPQHGDTVIIPAGRTVIIDNIQNLSNEDIFIRIYGTLLITNGKLWLGASSTITIYTGGLLSGAGSQSETVKIGGVTKFEGTHAPLGGPLQASGTTGAYPSGFETYTELTLPVRFTSFDLALENQDVLVQWTTADETNNHHFDIQRSENGRDWYPIAQVPGAGTVSAFQRYSYIDRNTVSPVLYYRISQVDHDGRSSITSVRMVKKDRAAGIRIDNAGSNCLYVHFPQKIFANVMVRLVSGDGREITASHYVNPVGQVLVPVIIRAPGIYIVTVTSDHQRLFTGKLIF